MKERFRQTQGQIIIHKETWERIGITILPPPLKKCSGASGQKLKSTGDFISDVSFYGKTVKAKAFMMERTYNVF